MTATTVDLDRTLVALADPTRRAILHRLSAGEARVTDLAAPFSISLNSVSKHIRMLERAELVRRRRAGREHYLSLNPAPLDEAAAWIAKQRSLWTARLSALDALLQAEDGEPDARPLGNDDEQGGSRMNQATVTVQVKHRFSASAERVFDAWLDPERAGRFLFATPTGEMVRVDIDARVGGKFNITERRDGEDAEHVGEYLEIERPRRLVFNFGDNVALPISKVTIEIVPLDSGCELTLTHERIPMEYAQQTTEGWAGILASLEVAIA